MSSEMNPGNTNDASRNAMDQNSIMLDQNSGQSLNQNIMNQDEAFPSQNSQPIQNLQPTQNAIVQNPPVQAPPSKSKKPILIACIVGAIVLIAAIIGIVCVVVMQNDENNDPADSVAGNITDGSEGNATTDAADYVDAVDDAFLDVDDVVDVEKFKQMTKAEAVAFLQAGRSTGGAMPKGYVDEEIMGLVIVESSVIASDVLLKYSYDTIDDLQKIAEEWYGLLGHNYGITEDDYTIKEYDYYTILTPNRIDGTNTCDYEYYGDCKSLLSFKRSYINYYQEETTPTSYNDVIYLNTQNPELVERLLKMYSFFYNGAASSHGNIYGSSFEEQDDMFVLTVYYVGVGLNVDKLKEAGGGVEYAINLYSRRYAADKADGQLHAIRTGEDSTVENIKSIPVTQMEAASLMSR